MFLGTQLQPNMELFRLYDSLCVGEGILSFISIKEATRFRLVNGEFKIAVFVFPWKKDIEAPTIRSVNLWQRCFGRAEFANVNETTRGLKLLRNSPQLKHIDAYQLSDGQLGRIFAVGSLTSLEINCGRPSRTWLTALKCNPNLTSLHLTQISAGQPRIQQLVAAYPNLQELTLHYVEDVDDAAIYECFTFAHLERLFIGTVVEDGDISTACLKEVIQRFGKTSIEEGLHVYNDTVPVDMLELIGPAVTKVNGFDSLDDSHLRLFDGNPGFELNGCPNVTEQGLRAYVARNPQLKRPQITVERAGVTLEQSQSEPWVMPGDAEPSAKKEKLDD